MEAEQPYHHPSIYPKYAYVSWIGIRIDTNELNKYPSISRTVDFHQQPTTFMNGRQIIRLLPLDK